MDAKKTSEKHHKEKTKGQCAGKWLLREQLGLPDSDEEQEESSLESGKGMDNDEEYPKWAKKFLLDIKKELKAYLVEMRHAVAQISKEVELQAEHLLEYDQRIMSFEQKIMNLQAASEKKDTLLKELENRAEDIESCSQRNNIRISDILEGEDMLGFLQGLFASALDLGEDVFEIDRVHRAL
nr:PREDICTED: uncharacterized protein LOC106704382 [Latimeria chalumnae]|eukprot:XP_014346757.1 PREDICTED: uncharacterized protein LOC106704382 [Latimeria chalumnae]